MQNLFFLVNSTTILWPKSAWIQNFPRIFSQYQLLFCCLIQMCLKNKKWSSIITPTLWDSSFFLLLLIYCMIFHYFICLSAFSICLCSMHVSTTRNQRGKKSFVLSHYKNSFRVFDKKSDGVVCRRHRRFFGVSKNFNICCFKNVSFSNANRTFFVRTQFCERISQHTTYVSVCMLCIWICYSI